MDRRGLRRRKAKHINPVPLFVPGLVLYILNITLSANGGQWWSIPAALAIIFFTGFTAYFSQSGYAENSSPPYFAILLFLVAAVPELATFDKSTVSAVGLCLAYLYLIRFICKENRKDYIANIAFLCIVASAITPIFIWFLPAVWIILFAESDNEWRDSVILIISSAISAILVVGTLFLIWNWPDAVSFAKQWSAATIASNPLSFSEIPMISGIRESWHSREFAESVTYCLYSLGGIIIFAMYLNRKSRMKTDDSVISGVSFIFAITAIILAYVFPEAGKVLWLVTAVSVSVPVSHLLATEGKHILMTIYLTVTFLCALMRFVPIEELL